MSELRQGVIRKVQIDEIKPYWRNPRDNAEAIQKVKESIKAFGYQQPICVDENNVIIVGHSRYKALKELGYDEVDVVVSDLNAKEAKKYRIIDNKTNEFAEWTDDLKLELREIEDIDFMKQFFTEDLDLETSVKEVGLVDEDELEDDREKLSTRFDDAPRDNIQAVVCPACGHDFEILVDLRKGGEKIG